MGYVLILGTKTRQVSWARAGGKIERVPSLEMSELGSQLPKMDSMLLKEQPIKTTHMVKFPYPHPICHDSPL